MTIGDERRTTAVSAEAVKCNLDIRSGSDLAGSA